MEEIKKKKLENMRVLLKRTEGIKEGKVEKDTHGYGAKVQKAHVAEGPATAEHRTRRHWILDTSAGLSTYRQKQRRRGDVATLMDAM